MSRPSKRTACCNLEDPNCCGSSRRIRSFPLPPAQADPGPSGRITEIEDFETDVALEAPQAGRLLPHQTSSNPNRIYKRPANREDFRIAIICALPIEYNAVSLLIDQWWDEEGNTYGRAQGDPNTYRNGRLGEHNVVLLLLPKMGKSSAAGSTASLRSSYYNISLALLVGICGGVPSVGKREILLGDVIIGERIFQYDFGRQYRGQHVPKDAGEGNLGNLNRDLSSLIIYFKTEPGRQEAQKKGAEYLRALQKTSIDTQCETNYSYPGTSQDRLFPVTYQHKHQEPVECPSCTGETESYCREADKMACIDLGCDDDMVVRRQRLKKKKNLGSEEEKQRPEVFVGNIASGDTVMRSSEHRDSIAGQGNIIAFEMEGAGAFDESPSLVVKGVCDYADSHKNKDWQPFAAATAASVAKAILERYTLPSIGATATPGKVGFDEQDQKCLADLFVTNPVDDKKRITQTKGNLLSRSYIWILKHKDFESWSHNETQVLWITGDPGKGKTMLLCGLIEELEPSTRLKDKTSDTLLPYFIFQGTDSRINNATAALRSLIYMLVKQHPSLILAVREKYDTAGKQLFQDPNAWFTLSELLTNILKNLEQMKVNIFIDALDECTTDLDKLISLVVQSSAFSHVKWVLSSRNVEDIHQRIRLHASYLRLHLEMEGNAEIVSKAVENYIEYSISELSFVFKEEVEILKVRNAMRKKSNGTFLWVSLVTKELKKANSWEVDQILDEFPDDLRAVYCRMVDQIKKQRPETQKLCLLMLSTLAVVYRPLHLEEIAILPQLPGNISGKLGVVKKLLDQCGSFFTLRNNYVYIIHQSAMDFLSSEGICLLPQASHNWRAESHDMVFSRSLEVLSTTLRRDIYDLEEPGFLAEDVETPDQDPLLPVRYSCIYWIDHFQMGSDGRDSPHHEEIILAFLKTHFLHWLEALSLIGKISEGARTIVLLESIVQARGNVTLCNFAYDARRFLLYFASIIREAPLQTYCSALSFAPRQSLVRQQFESEILHSINVAPLEESWGSLVQMLEGHKSDISCVAVSPDGKTIASVSHEGEVILWNLLTGTLLNRFEDSRIHTYEVFISPDGSQVATIAPRYDDIVILIWDSATGTILQDCWHTLRDHDHHINPSLFVSAAFSIDSQRIILSFLSSKYSHGCYTELIYDVRSNRIAKEYYLPYAATHALSPDGATVAYVTRRGLLKTWDIATEQDLITFDSNNAHELLENGDRRDPSASLISFSPDGQSIALACNHTIKLFDTTTGSPIKSLRYQSLIMAISFSPDSSMLACALGDTTVKLWDTKTDLLLPCLEGHGKTVDSIVFSPNCKMVAIASKPTTIITKSDFHVRLWNTTTGELLRVLEVDGCGSNTMAFLPNSETFVFADGEAVVRRWNVITGDAMPAIEREPLSAQPDRVLYESPYGSSESAVSFSPDSKTIALVAYVRRLDLGLVRLWDRETRTHVRTLECHGKPVYPIFFSPNGETVVAAFNTLRLDVSSEFENYKKNSIINVWGLETGILLNRFSIPEFKSYGITLSPDGQTIALRSRKEIILVDSKTGPFQRVCWGELNYIYDISYTHCGKTIACLIADPSGAALKFWDVATEAFLRQRIEFKRESTAKLKIVYTNSAPTPGQKIFVISWQANGIRIQDGLTGAALGTFVGNYSYQNSAFSPDGKYILSSSIDKKICVQELGMSKPADKHPVISYTLSVPYIALSQNQEVAILASPDIGELGVFNTVTGEILHTWRPPHYETSSARAINGIALSPDGTKIAFWSSWPNVNIELYDVHGNLLHKFPFGIKDSKILESFYNSRNYFTITLGLVFSSDGKELTFLSEFQHTTGPRGGDIQTMTSNPSSHSLFTYDTSSGRLLTQLDFTVDVSGFVISPNREILASVTSINYKSAGEEDWEGLVQLHSIEDLRLINTLGKLKFSPGALKFSQDSKILVVGRSSGIIIWDFFTSSILGEFSFNAYFGLEFYEVQILPSPLQSNAFYLRVDAGVMNLPNTSKAKEVILLSHRDYPTAFSKFLAVSYLHKNAATTPTPRDRHDRWIFQGGRKVLWLPEEYEVKNSCFQDESLVLYLRNGRIIFFRSR
ncbi:hypothetical protein TWF718_001841 [Orbilia javanica]|uniref:NACHT domain-containing protein n=1 Tax=Orbilia javanica TaxID=47235 RepID=A0AAN8MVU4_9PEZI